MMLRGLLSFKEIFDFSRRSEDSANFVRELTASLTPRVHVSISESEGKFKIAFGRSPTSHEETRFNMILASGQKAKELLEEHPEKIETIVVNSVEYGFYLENDYIGYYVIVPEDVKKDGLVLLEHFKDIFSAELKNLEIAPGVAGVEAASKGLTVMEGKVTHEQMAKYLEEESEEKILECTPEPSGFSYNHPIPVDRLVIQNSQWFSRQNLLNLDCSRISLGRSTLTSEDLNEFIKKWLISDNKKFKQLVVSEALSEHQMLNLDVISSGLDTMPTCKKRKTDDFGLWKLQNQKLIAEFDIRRDDGVIATVTLSTEDSGNEKFQFEVQEPKKKKRNPFSLLDYDAKSVAHFLERSKKTHQEMVNLLENGDSEKLNIYQQPEDGFVYDKPISTRDFSLHPSHWFTRQNLLSLDCEKIYLERSKLTNKDVNAFIKQWFISDNKKLRSLKIWAFGSGKESFKPDLAVITAGIPTVPGKKRKNLKRKLYTDGNKYEKGLEIIRSDGLEANVLLQEDRYLEEGQKHFLFTVWHPKEKKASDKDSYQEDMEKVADEVDLDDFEMC